MGRYLINLLISIDQFINTIFGGKPDDTISSRAHKLYRIGKPLLSRIIDSIFFWEKNHCEKSVEDDE